MNRHIISFAIALASIGTAAACGCEPGTLVFEDAFFRYCDAARAAHLAQQDPASDRERRRSAPAADAPGESHGNTFPEMRPSANVAGADSSETRREQR